MTVRRMRAEMDQSEFIYWSRYWTMVGDREQVQGR